MQQTAPTAFGGIQHQKIVSHALQQLVLHLKTIPVALQKLKIVEKVPFIALSQIISSNVLVAQTKIQL